MKKRMLCSLLALSMALLCGCAGDGMAAEPSGTGLDPTFTPGETLDISDLRETLPKEALSACITQAKQTAEQVPEYTGSPLIPVDPDRQVYISIGEQDCDFYEDGWFTGFGTLILTREPYSVEQIKVNIPMQTCYTVEVTDVTENYRKIASDLNSMEPGIKDYQYLCLQGVDWRWLAQERKYVESAYALFGEDPFSKEYQAYVYMEEAYEQLLTDYRAQYDGASLEELPRFYVYNVSIMFMDMHTDAEGMPIGTGPQFADETVEFVEITIGDEVYPVDIGQWRFHRQLPAELAVNKPEGLTQGQRVVTGASGSPYDGEIVQLLNALSFTANKDLIITGVHQINDPVNILGGRVIISDVGGNASADFYWDLQRPLEIAAGAQVSIDLYVKDACFARYSMSKTAYLIMDYEIDGKAYGMSLPCILGRGNPDVWETYLMAFEGYDMGEYYTLYAPSTTAYWLPDLPEEWRQQHG